MGVALVLFMLLVAGLVDAGRAVWARTTVQYASTQAVRWASVRSEDSGNPATAETIETWVENQARILDPDRLTVTTTWTPSNVPGATVSVTVSYDYQPVLDFLPIDAVTFTFTSSQIISY
jgi:Flp pilus assembly protein TadG